MTRQRLLAHAWLQLALWVAIAVVAVHLAHGLRWRFDLTHDQRHSLSPVSIATLRTLDQPLTATVWFTEDLGPPYHTHRQTLLDLLAGLQAESEGLLDVVVRDPTGDEALSAAAMRAGVRPVTWAYRDRTQTQARQVWMGLSLDQAERHAAVDALPVLERMEHDLLQALLSVTTETEDRKTVGWVRGNGEPDLASFGADHPLGKLRTGLEGRYDLVVVDLSAEIDPAVDALLMVGPQHPVGSRAIENLEAFTRRGGAVGLFLSAWQPDFQQMQIRPVPHELDGLLGRWGLAMGKDLLLDRTRNEVTVLPVKGQLARVSYPLVPVSAGFDRRQQPVRELREAALPFASSVGVLDDTLDSAVWLATEATSRSTSQLVSLQLSSVNAESPGELPGPHPVMVAVSGSLAGQGAPTRVVLAGSADLVPNQVELVLNTVDWLLADPRLIEVRAHSAGPPPLLPPDQPTLWKAGIAGFPLLGLVLIGGVLGLRRRR